MLGRGREGGGSGHEGIRQTVVLEEMCVTRAGFCVHAKLCGILGDVLFVLPEAIFFSLLIK